MSDQYNSFFEKKKIHIPDIMYITRSGRKTVVNLVDGSKIETFEPIKRILEGCPAKLFESINKGIVIAPRYVVNVKDNVYTMKDGMTFMGRVRTTQMQKDNIAKYNDKMHTSEWASFAEFDNLPVAFCIIELVFDELGHGVDFVFRYCNKEMETLEGKRIDEMIDRSFYEVFENGDKKWLITYADVALNGGKKVIESYSPEIDATLRIYCYQPKPNYCACVLIQI